MVQEVDYDEDKGNFIIKNKLLWIIPQNKEIMEKDLTVDQINELKQKADKTTLTNYDIDILYQFAKMKFNYTGSKNEFTKIPIVQLFPGLHNSKLKTNEIMPLAYDHVKFPSKLLVLEKFEESRVDGNKYYYLLCFIVLILFLVLFIMT
jgi:hypothetical protein